MGARAEYRFSQDFNLGATVMNLSEKPLTQKVNVGDDPINNTIIGLDGNYFTESQFLTQLVDYLPFIDTKERSTISIYGEVAQLFPGHSKAIDNNGGTSYIDDFEGSQSRIDLRAFTAWQFASIPQAQNSLFPEASLKFQKQKV